MPVVPLFWGYYIPVPLYILKNIEHYIKAFQTFITTIGYFSRRHNYRRKVSFGSMAYLQIYTNEGKPKSVCANVLHTYLTLIFLIHCCSGTLPRPGMMELAMSTFSVPDMLPHKYVAWLYVRSYLVAYSN